jgi:PIN domain nuclease of toxin-antitoxin system
MRLLVDTHALLWFVTADPQLSIAAHTALADPQNQRVVSIVSLWEIAIKHSLGRLPLILPLADFIAQHVTLSKVRLLPITVAHILKVAGLPHHHRDPFDRLLIAQALVENIPIVSVDDKFDPYGITRIW